MTKGRVIHRVADSTKYSVIPAESRYGFDLSVSIWHSGQPPSIIKLKSTKGLTNSAETISWLFKKMIFSVFTPLYAKINVHKKLKCLAANSGLDPKEPM